MGDGSVRLLADASVAGEVSDWQKHREVLLTVPAREVFRGCVGLAAYLADGYAGDGIVSLGDRILVPDREVRWAWMVDIPSGHFRLGKDHSGKEKTREVHLATYQARAQVKFGMPHLCHADGCRSCDFRVMPHDRVVVSRGGSEITFPAGPDVLPAAGGQPRIFRILNGLNWAMTTTAFAFRSPWSDVTSGRDKLAARFGVSSWGKLFAFGPGLTDRMEGPEVWMPRCYLGIHESELDGLLSDRALEGSVVTEDFRDHFLGRGFSPYKSPHRGVAFVRREASRYQVMVTRVGGDLPPTVVAFGPGADVRVSNGALVKEGEVLATEVVRGVTDVPGWERKPLSVCWDRLTRSLGGRMHDYLRMFFMREVVRVRPGVVYLPSVMVAAAASSSATLVDDMMWDVEPSMPYYREELEAWIFPTLRLGLGTDNKRQWYNWRIALPGVEADFTPADPRVSLPERAGRRPSGRPVSCQLR